MIGRQQCVAGLSFVSYLLCTLLFVIASSRQTTSGLDYESPLNFTMDDFYLELESPDRQGKLVYMNYGYLGVSGPCTVPNIQKYVIQPSNATESLMARHMLMWGPCGENLARQLGEAVHLNADDDVVDLGFGRGVQDLFFASSFHVRSIVGFNVGERQTALANFYKESWPSKVRKAISFRVGDAAMIPLRDGVASKVISLENAFHYNTRSKFFAEAFRVLKPGGILGLADILPVGCPASSCRPDFFPPENNVSTAQYRLQLEFAGFHDVQMHDITPHIAWWFIVPRLNLSLEPRDGRNYFLVTARKLATKS